MSYRDSDGQVVDNINVLVAPNMGTSISTYSDIRSTPLAASQFISTTVANRWEGGRSLGWRIDLRAGVIDSSDAIHRDMPVEQLV